MLAKHAKESRRVTAKEHAVENKKYYFRCFLFRLGLIGPEYKSARKILLKNLEGSSTFRVKKLEYFAKTTEMLKNLAKNRIMSNTFGLIWHSFLLKFKYVRRN